jgi:RNA polymerase sigma factor (sigma-70 family)
MLASFEEAEDAVQETFLRAWRSRERFDGGALARAWLYRIATNVCFDVWRQHARRPPGLHSYAEVPWRIRAGVSLRSQVRFSDYLAKRGQTPALSFREHLRAVGGAIEECPPSSARERWR